MKKLETKINVTVNAEAAKEAREKTKKIAKEIAHISISAVGGAFVGGIIGASIQKAGNYSRTANTLGNLAGMTSSVATSLTLYDKLQRSDEIRQKQLEFLDQTLVSYKEEDLLYEEEDLEEGGEKEEA